MVMVIAMAVMAVGVVAAVMAVGVGVGVGDGGDRGERPCLGTLLTGPSSKRPDCSRVSLRKLPCLGTAGQDVGPRVLGECLVGVRGPQRRLSALRGPVCPETWASPHHLPGGPRTELWLTSGSCPSWHSSRWGPITVGGPSALRPAGLGLACDRTLEGQAWGGGREVMLGREGAGALTGGGAGGAAPRYV